MQSRAHTFHFISCALPAVLILTLVIHFGMTLLYLTPLNPIKARLGPIISAYMEPRFSQKWELFAPDPIVDTRILLVSCSLARGPSGEEQTPWVDITTPLRSLKYRYRFTPADRLERAQDAALFMVFGEPDAAMVKLQQQRDSLPVEIRSVTDSMEKVRAEDAVTGRRLLARIASTECVRRYAPIPVRRVQLRMVVIEPPPFSQRSRPNKDGKTTVVQFDSTPLETVAPF
jgi:hypothetical protein